MVNIHTIYNVNINWLIKKALTFICMNAKINLLKHFVMQNMCVDDAEHSHIINNLTRLIYNGHMAILSASNFVR